MQVDIIINKQVRKVMCMLRHGDIALHYNVMICTFLPTF